MKMKMKMNMETVNMTDTPIPTFTAEQFNKRPGDVFRYVDRNGAAQINHANYPDKIFTITGRDKVRIVKREQ